MIWLAGLPVIWWGAILLADAIQPGRNLFELMEVLTEKLNHPFQFHYTEYTIKSVLVCTLLYAAGIGIFYSSQKNYRRGEEHGSARWGDARQICKKYSQKPYSQNILLTQNFRISLDTHKHRRCLNILVVGGSGAGKSRGFALPNIMQCCCSMVITDPKAELLRKTGGLLEKKGYEVRVFDLINPDTSFCYNPFEYVHDDKDVLRLISNLIQNTTPKGSQSSDPFWEKSETALLQALMLYLLHEAPPEEQNFAMIMEMLGSAQVKEEDEDYESPLDILFDRLEMRDPDSIAVKQYHIYKQAAGDTCYSWSEDTAMYNPDGKEIIARDNEISILRKEDISKAYFGCHTDITIPYDELGSICALGKNGEKISIIEDGRFVLAGTEELNKPFEE